jgi:hypothetical protein
MKHVEHLHPQETDAHDRSGDGQYLAETEATDRLGWPGKKVKNVERGKAEDESDEDVVDVVGTLG